VSEDFFYPKKEVPPERAVLVGAVLRGQDRGEEEDNLIELGQLANAAGAKVLQAVVQERRAPDVGTYIGKGKVEELKEICRRRDANLIVFDNELSPVQARNLESLTDTNVCDRSELILDIFAQRARTKQARLQVELAQLEYLRPRLRRMWEHLSRQAGGIGTRGPGETQLEVDRRRLGERVSRLKRDLEKIERISETQARRRRHQAFTIALVGYTNVGKSSIMNALTSADQHVEDALFATLDSTTRRLNSTSGEAVLVSDTVGFVRKLPHHLVESFKATLAEVREADLLLHVADLSSPTRDRQIAAVEEVLGDLDIDPDSTLRVFNKVDILDTRSVALEFQVRWPGAILVSAQTGDGLPELREEILRCHREAFKECVLLVPVGLESLTGKIYAAAEVTDVRYREEGAYYRLRLEASVKERLLGLGVKERDKLLENWDEEGN
jgi:GTP-binding protein HflX